MLRQLLLLSVFLSLSLAQTFGPIDLRAAAEECTRGSKCRFFPCSNLPVIVFTSSNFAVNPPICRLNQDISTFDIGEPSVIKRKGRTISKTKLSKWKPTGLSRGFRSDTFKPLKISPGTENLGLARKHVLGNQNKFTHGTCFEVPVTRYTQVKPKGMVSIDTSDPNKDCFVFVANTPDILFDAQWFGTGDDLDVEVREPDGTVVNYINPRSASGRLIGGDSNIDGCELRDEGREKVGYFRSNAKFQTGKYKVTLRHRSNCGEGRTKWHLRVLVGGVLKASKSGTSNDDSGAVISTLAYVL